MDKHLTIPDKQPGFSLPTFVVIMIIIAGLAVFPFVITNRFYISLINEMLIYGLLAMSLDVLLGFTGLLSFMHNAYLGISAYAVGLFLIHVSPSSLWLACLTGVFFTALVALPVGWVQVRTGGLAFALLTLAFGMMFHTIVWKWYGLTGGDDGLMDMPNPAISIFGWEIGHSGDPTAMYLLTLVVVTICYLGRSWNPFGKMKSVPPSLASMCVCTNCSDGCWLARWPVLPVRCSFFTKAISVLPP